ncbi:MAG: helix-turn-helix transcriptional regulator [Desulfobacteraceae bacterium]|nr:helix-turn-helix transcriptional regulator [Desulfobacteraceae bacterium]
MLIKILCGTDLIFHYLHFAQTYRPLPFLIWALLYFYIKAMTNPDFRFQLKDSIHLIPFLLYTLLLLPFFLSGPSVKIEAASTPLPPHYFFAVLLQTTLLFFYLIQSHKILRDHRRRIQEIFANTEKVKLVWLEYLLAAFGIIWLVAFIIFLSGIRYKTDFVIPPALLCLAIYGIGFYALKQPEIFKNIKIDTFHIEPENKLTNPSVTNFGKRSQSAEQLKNPKRYPKYEYSMLTQQDLSSYRQKLIKYLEHDKPYLSNDLKLQDIADYLELPSYQLSQVINTELNCNFYTLINSYRIDEAKRHLINPAKQHLAILEIAYEVGFNSKSAFNTSFKKSTDTTPSQYKIAQSSRSITA